MTWTPSHPIFLSWLTIESLLSLFPEACAFLNSGEEQMTRGLMIKLKDLFHFLLALILVLLSSEQSFPLFMELCKEEQVVCKVKCTLFVYVYVPHILPFQ